MQQQKSIDLQISTTNKNSTNRSSLCTHISN